MKTSNLPKKELADLVIKEDLDRRDKAYDNPAEYIQNIVNFNVGTNQVTFRQSRDLSKEVGMPEKMCWWLEIKLPLAKPAFKTDEITYGCYSNKTTIIVQACKERNYEPLEKYEPKRAAVRKQALCKKSFDLRGGTDNCIGTALADLISEKKPKKHITLRRQLYLLDKNLNNRSELFDVSAACNISKLEKVVADVTGKTPEDFASLQVALDRVLKDRDYDLRLAYIMSLGLSCIGGMLWGAAAMTAGWLTVAVIGCMLSVVHLPIVMLGLGLSMGDHGREDQREILKEFGVEY